MGTGECKRWEGESWAGHLSTLDSLTLSHRFWASVESWFVAQALLRTALAVAVGAASTATASEGTRSSTCNNQDRATNIQGQADHLYRYFSFAIAGRMGHTHGLRPAAEETVR